jgi:nucleoside-diphosphate-sugar epimerase
MDILVTGATGCLGRNLVLRLAADARHHVAAVGRNAAVGAALQGGNVQFVAADITDKETMTRLIRGKDAVVHCAALTAPWGAYDRFYRSNVIGTANVVSASLEAGVSRFVHVSTPSIYHDGHAREMIREADALPGKAANHYVRTKREAEAIVEAAHRQGLPAVTIRPRAIFGPHDTAILPRLIRVARRGWFPLLARGAARIDVTCVSNVVDALMLCLNADTAVLGKKYNITNGEPMTVRELMAKVFDALGLSVKFIRIPFQAAYALAAAMECLNRLPPFSRREPALTR